jgi:hypothetical protein
MDLFVEASCAIENWYDLLKLCPTAEHKQHFSVGYEKESVCVDKN